MKRLTLCAVAFVLLSSCATTPYPEMDVTEALEAKKDFYGCVGMWTETFHLTDARPEDIAYAAVGKCEQHLQAFRSAVAKQASIRFERSDKYYGEMLDLADSSSSKYRNDAMRKSIAYQLEMRLEQ